MVYSRAFLQRFKFLITFVKSLLKTKIKLKYRYRQKIAKYRGIGTGTTKVPTVPVPVPRKYRGTGTAVLSTYGCRASNGIGRLHICEGMMNATKYAVVLETKLLASARSLFPDECWIFQDDNAPCHRAKLVKRLMQSHRVVQMNWPAPSPDLNPIENLWHRINVIIAKN